MADSDNRVYFEAARDILDNLLRLCGFAVDRIEEVEEGGQLEFRIESEDNGRLIGRLSQTLDAIQFLLNRIMSRKFDDAPYCVVDAGEYRARRKEKLVADALAAAEQVRTTGRAWRMPLLNSMDRRVIHKALLEVPDVETHSEDADFDGRKRVVITLAKGAQVVALQAAEEPVAEPEVSEVPEAPENPEIPESPAEEVPAADDAGEPPAPPAEAEAALPAEEEEKPE